MEMKGWIVGFVLLGIAIPMLNCEHLDEETDRSYVGQRKFSSNLSKGNAEMLGIPDEADDQDKEDDPEMNAEPVVNNGERPAGVFIRDPSLKGGVGILIIQNGPASSLPLMFELRPITSSDSEGPFIDIDDGDLGVESEDYEDSDESDVFYVADNRFKPNSALDGAEWIDDEEDYDDQGVIPTKRPNRPNRPTKKSKRKPSNQLSHIDDESYEPSTPTPTPTRKPKRPVVQQNKKKRRKNKNRGQVLNQNKRKNKNKNKNKIQNQNKNKNPNRRQKPNMQKRKPQQAPNRRKNNGNRKKHVGVNVRKGGSMGTMTNTVTTTQTGPAAGDEPNVNYIIINKPTPTPTTERPFWDILGRSAGDDVRDRSFRPRKGFHRRSLG